MRTLRDTCWDVDDVLAMCDDAELIKLDEYGAGFVNDMRNRVARYGMRMALSFRQEQFLMTVATNGLRKGKR